MTPIPTVSSESPPPKDVRLPWETVGAEDPPVHAIVSLLDPAHYAQVEGLWAMLAESFGVRGVYVTPYPHFSYQAAWEYDVERLAPILQRVAAETAPFTVRTAGLGVFMVARPVLFIAVARSLATSRKNGIASYQ